MFKGVKIMELKHDLVREILLDIEDKGFNKFYFVDSLKFNRDGSERNEDDIIYTLSKLVEANFIEGNPIESYKVPVNFFVKDLTWSGHEFLDNIRDDGVWKDIKNVTKNLSSVSLTLIGKLGFQYLSNKFNLT
jgi:hypothetical protein